MTMTISPCLHEQSNERLLRQWHRHPRALVGDLQWQAGADDNVSPLGRLLPTLVPKRVSL